MLHRAWSWSWSWSWSWLSTVKALTGRSMPRRAAGASGRRTKASSGSSAAAVSVTTSWPGVARLDQAGQQVDQRPVVVALPRGDRPDADRATGRREDRVGGGGPAHVEPDATGGGRGRGGEEHLVPDGLDDAAAGQHGARPGGRLEPGQGQALFAQVQCLGPGGGADQVDEAQRHHLGGSGDGRAVATGEGRPGRRRGWARTAPDPARHVPARPAARPARRRPSPSEPGRRAPAEKAMVAASAWRARASSSSPARTVPGPISAKKRAMAASAMFVAARPSTRVNARMASSPMSAAPCSNATMRPARSEATSVSESAGTPAATQGPQDAGEVESALCRDGGHRHHVVVSRV